ncbi:MAG: putative ABC transporter permease [Eubacteriales bacterium]|jgi:hypothetical protein
MEQIIEAINHFAIWRHGVHTDSFAYGVNGYKLAWMFLIGCFIGYVLEMLWCYAKNGYWESRKGVVYGPFSPVYGLGAVLFTLLLHPFLEANSLLIFLVSMVLGGAFEYACSLGQEKLFGTVSWEYSQSSFNLHGRTNLSYSILWGLLGVVFLKHTYPFCSALIEMLPNAIGIPLTWVLSLLMAWDLLLSSLAVRRWHDRSQGETPHTAIGRSLDRHWPDDRMKAIYPNMIRSDEAHEKRRQSLVQKLAEQEARIRLRMEKQEELVRQQLEKKEALLRRQLEERQQLMRRQVEEKQALLRRQLEERRQQLRHFTGKAAEASEDSSENE